MNFSKFSLLAGILFTSAYLSAQTIPQTKVKDLAGNIVSTSQFANEGKPMLISFWATWCKPCLTELRTYQDVYEEWQEETGVKLIAISIDDTRNSGKVGPMVKSEQWKYEVYIDENQDLKRNLGVVNIPHTFLLDGEGNIVWQHAGYSPGDEDYLFEVIKKVAAGQKVN